MNELQNHAICKNPYIWLHQDQMEIKNNYILSIDLPCF